ncbi:membrane protein [Salmonella enterica subsp. enterica serovar Choleraesuis]|nr:membrane protein [Salmonella enterica subsp. enterica serovar Choleraesuis]
MSLSVFGILLFAAAMHATWNAIVKAAENKQALAIGVNAGAALIAAVALPFVSQPALPSLPWLAGSCLLQVVYTLLVAKTYQIADMSQTYPVMRGTAPLLVALFSALYLEDSLPAHAWWGIGIICSAILAMAFNSRHGSSTGLLMALLIACFIAGYTLLDGVGVRLSGAAAGYALWSFLLNGLTLSLWGALRLRRSLIIQLRPHWGKALAGGACTLGSYGLALWAMTQAPLAIVAALRETSILFAAIIAIVILREKPRLLQVAAAAGIAAGAMVLRLG